MPTALEQFMSSEAPAAPPARAPRVAAVLNPTMAAMFAPVPISVEGAGERTLTVARYGRIYKRKPPSAQSFMIVPSPPGQRYCKHCKHSLPLSEFYTDVTRYICKRHHYLRVRVRCQERFREDQLLYVATIAWRRLLKACPLLGYLKPRFDCHDVMDLIDHANISPRLSPVAVPIDPTIPMRPRNVAILAAQDFTTAERMLCATTSRAQYIMFVQTCNLLPPTADPGTPWAPFQDPEYRRADIDVAPILAEERATQPHATSADVLRRIQQKLIPHPPTPPASPRAAAAGGG